MAGSQLILLIKISSKFINFKNYYIIRQFFRILKRWSWRQEQDFVVVKQIFVQLYVHERRKAPGNLESKKLNKRRSLSPRKETDCLKFHHSLTIFWSRHRSMNCILQIEFLLEGNATAHALNSCNSIKK